MKKVNSLQLSSFLKLFEQFPTETQFEAVRLLNSFMDDRNLPKEYYYVIYTGYSERLVTPTKLKALTDIFNEYESENDHTINLKFVSYENPNNNFAKEIGEFSKNDKNEYKFKEVKKLTDRKTTQIYDFLLSVREHLNDSLCIQSDEELVVSDLIRNLKDVKFCRIFNITETTIYNTYIDEIQQVITFVSLDTESG